MHFHHTETANHCRAKIHSPVRILLFGIFSGDCKLRPVFAFALISALSVALLCPGSALADQIKIVIHGIEEPLLGNVENRVRISRLSSNNRLSDRRLKQIQTNSERRAASAIQPFGFYRPSIRSELRRLEDRSWQLDLYIDRGPPVMIANTDLNVSGDGSSLAALLEWRQEWPLLPGRVLDQVQWENLKQDGLDRAKYDGYLSAHFILHTIELDLNSNTADVALHLETGAQSVMGTVTFDQNLVRPDILEKLPRFAPGDPYNAWLIERFRFDLWNTGYYSSIEVVELKQPDAQPPRVDFQVNLEPRNRNTYQGTLGFGTDTGPRLQFQWNRHLISSRGDSFALAVGWQEQNSETSIRANYRLPRRARARDYWVPEALIRRENRDLKIKQDDSDPDFVKIANGNIDEYSIRFGRLRVHNLRLDRQQITETVYGQFLREESSYTLEPEIPESDPATRLAPALSAEDLDALRSSSSLSFGININWPVIRGNGFETVGHHQRMWFFTSNKAWGSEREFTQAYFSSRWNFIAGRRWKFLFRGEVGYTDAKVIEIADAVPGSDQTVSVTLLPNLYRFKAGGSHSVRGYGYEELTNNGIGSNHIITGSAEAEFLIRENWSLAAFFDIGNSFNDWNEPNLKRGVGAGIRWYSIAGPVRLDFAQALDFDGQPWRIHFTIGIPLL
jgi:translocation and assembly module TamA